MVRKIFKRILLGFLIFLLLFASYLFIGKTQPAEKINWGVNFSQKQAEHLELDWRETYLALLDDLGAKNLKISVHWDLLEQEEGSYNFEDLDWQIKEAEERARGARVLLVIGMKTPRWPECHIPEWATNLGKEKQQERILKLIEEIVLRYRESETIWAWQTENEPFFPFGECPWTNKAFLKEEVELVKSLDLLNRPVLISDSGEGSFWIQAAKLGDIVGTSMYKKVWFAFPPPFLERKLGWLKELEFGFYLSYPLPPTFYARKAQIIKKLFGKEVICVELQAEPWGPRPIPEMSPEEQGKTMNLARFQKMVEFAKKTGLREFYFWGAEWWYWMKEKQNESAIWDEAEKLF